MKRVLLSLTVGSIALTTVFQERAMGQRRSPAPNPEGLRYLDNQLKTPMLKNSRIRFESSVKLEELRQYRKAWSKTQPLIAPLIGQWSDGIEGGFAIYPSSKPNQVCILAPFSARVQPGYVNGKTIAYYDGNRGDDAMSIIHNLGRERVIGVKFSEIPDSKLIPFFMAGWLEPGSKQAEMFETAGCLVNPPTPETTNKRSANPNTPTYATNLGGSTYFSWQWQTNSGASDSSEPRIVAGYGCVTRNQIAGVAPQQAFANRYKLIRFRGTDEWALEFVEGISIKPTEKGYVSHKLSGMPGKELQRYVTDRESGFLKKEMGAADGLGLACINDGMAGVLKNIRQEYNIAIDVPGELTADEPIAQPTEPVKTLPPIARASTYAYPSPEEFTQFRQTLKTQPSPKLSAIDHQSRQTFLKKWQTDNPPIAPFIGTWTTREGRSIYVYPSTQRLRACVVTVKDGNPSFTMALAQGPELRYGNSGLFKTEQGDLLASRQEGEKDLVPVFAAVGVPVLSEDVQQELAQAKCGGMAIGSKR